VRAVAGRRRGPEALVEGQLRAAGVDPPPVGHDDLVADREDVLGVVVGRDESDVAHRVERVLAELVDRDGVGAAEADEQPALVHRDRVGLVADLGPRPRARRDRLDDLVGRGVDEDGDIIDKYGNVKGHVEPYEEPEEAGPEDLSSLAGKTVNRPGRQLSRAQERADATTPNPIEHSQPPEKPKEAALVHRVFSRTKDFGIANSLPKGEEDMDVTSAIHDETDELVLQYTHIQKSELAGLREELSRAMMQI